MIAIPEFDDAAFAKEQRRLLKLATQTQKTAKDRTRPDEAAAAKLLLYFSRDMLVDSSVQEAVLDGVREVAAYVVNQTLLRHDGQPLSINPLMYFLGVESAYSSTKKNKKSERVAMAAAFNDPEVPGSQANGTLMTAREAKHALTTRWTINDVKDGQFGGERKLKKDWPKTVKDVEKKLVEYVAELHRASSKDACQRYVWASFPAIGWGNDSDKAVTYPESWNS